MQIFSKTDIGRVRRSNQDAYFAGTLFDGSALVVVCDGMGGANAGNVASETAVKLISEYVIKSYRESSNDTEISSVLKSAVVSANLEIYEMSLNDEHLMGMGTTAVVAIVRDDFAVICHVGDSRAYLVSDSVVQLTRDHSVVQTLVESGKLTVEEAKIHPKKNVITRAIGAEEDIVPDCNVISLSSGDKLLICTDGLTNFVDNTDILKVFEDTDEAKIPEMLTYMANENGGGDNITVVTVSLG